MISISTGAAAMARREKVRLMLLMLVGGAAFSVAQPQSIDIVGTEGKGPRPQFPNEVWCTGGALNDDTAFTRAISSLGPDGGIVRVFGQCVVAAPIDLRNIAGPVRIEGEGRELTSIELVDYGAVAVETENRKLR